MISRRDFSRLCAAVALMAPAISLTSPRGAVALAMRQNPAAGWPMHGGNPARTGVMTGVGPRFDMPVAVKWSWPATSGGGGWTAPVIHEGVMYQSRGLLSGLHAVDFASGAERWHVWDGLDVSQQIVSNGVVFAVVDSQVLYALDSVTGNELWQTRIDGILGHSLVAVAGMLYCRTTTGGGMAMNATDGSQRWYFEELAGESSSLAVHDGTLYLDSSNGALIALDAIAGTERWRLAFPPRDTSTMTQSTIIVADDTVYLCDYQGSVYAVDPASGTEHWRTPAGTLSGLAAVHHGRIYGTHGSQGVSTARALDAATGTMLWDFVTPLYMEVSGVCGDTVLAQGTAGAREMWRVHGLDAATGVERWSFECPPRSYRPLVVGDLMMLSGLSGYVLGNVMPTTLIQNVILRGAPSPTGVERGKAMTGDVVDQIGVREQSGGEIWVEVTIDEVVGWIPLNAIDPATLPPEGEIEYVYVP